MKALASENESLKSKLARGALGDVMNQVVEVKGVKLLAAKVEGVDMNGLRDLGDQLKEKLGEGVVVLAAVNEGKVNLLAMATDSAQKAGAHAGNPDQSCCCNRWRRRWRTSEYGSGWWKESGEGRRGNRSSSRNPGRTDSLKNTQNFVKNFCKIKPKVVDESRVHDI